MPFGLKGDDNDALPLLEHVESRCEETLDFSDAATLSY